MKENIDPVAEARFECSACNNEAGHIQLLRGPTSAELRRMSFTSAFSSVVSHEHFDTLRMAIADRDVRALHSLDLEYTPFFCPRCDAIYCGDHWETWDVFAEDDPHWHDSIRGRCPNGHERMLED
ncbi:MAG: hypothetical protein ABR568_04070 [Pyrinomonadaceae bacterium]